MIPHILRHNKGNSFPRNWVFFDTETETVYEDSKKIIQKTRLIIAQHHRIDKQPSLQKTLITKDNDEFFKFIISCLRSKTRLMVCSHNIAFDVAVTGLIDKLLDDGWDIRKLIVSNEVTYIKFKKLDYSIDIIDSFNFLRMSLKQIGISIGVEKLEVDFKNASDDELTEYCLRDVNILSTAMINFINFCHSNNLGTLGITIASQSYNAFRHRFMSKDIFIHNNTKAAELEMNSYYGGRVECFQLGTYYGKFYKLDVNSMYPYVMISNLYPTKLVAYHSERINKLRISDFKNNYLAIAHVTVNTDEDVYPYRTKKGMLIFPTGEFQTYLNTPSLAHAILRGHIKNIHEIAWYKGDDIFTEYVSFFYSMRRKFKSENNKVYEFICKLFLNSLYGKFGQRANETKIIPADSIHMRENFESIIDEEGNIWHCIKIRDKIYMMTKKKKPAFNSFIAIASHVTDYARMQLYQYIKEAGKENVMYVDTDSLIVNEQGYLNLKKYISPDELGKLKLEEEGDYITIHGLKDYETKNYRKIKGIKLNSTQLSNNVYLVNEFPSMKTVLKQNMHDSITITKKIKKLNREYRKTLELMD